MLALNNSIALRGMLASNNRITWRGMLASNNTQVKNYGPVPAGKHRKSLERGSSIPTGKFSDFFR